MANISPQFLNHTGRALEAGSEALHVLTAQSVAAHVQVYEVRTDRQESLAKHLTCEV